MTLRDEEILATLCNTARFFSMEQIAREWWPNSPKGVLFARRRLKRLAQEGWLNSIRLLARPLLALENPVTEWAPGNSSPDAKAISRILRRRWKMPAIEMELFLASAKARTIFGGAIPGTVKNVCQTTHDLHVAEVFLFYRRNKRPFANAWVGEDQAGRLKNQTKIPDASLRDENGNIFRFIEFGGSYAAARVAEFHRYCVAQQIPYEMW